MIQCQKEVSNFRVQFLDILYLKLASFLADIYADIIGKVGRLSVSADTDFFHIGRSLN